MKILMLLGSPHAQGTTALLADEFCLGAKEAGHEVVKFETAKLNINPCLGCDHCSTHKEGCIQRDGMLEIYPHLLAADGVVFVTPLYYFGMSAQIKSTIDRFYAVNSDLQEKPKAAYLLVAGADEEAWVMTGIKTHFQTICRYLKWQDKGTVLALGAAVPEDLAASDYLQAARKLGRGEGLVEG